MRLALLHGPFRLRTVETSLACPMPSAGQIHGKDPRMEALGEGAESFTEV